MVNGIEKFRLYFKDFKDNYIIIGGTACDIIMVREGLKARATKDIDMILVIEAISSEFVQTFWEFIKDGNYARKEISDDKRQYYRFISPEKIDYPQQIELFSRNPDLIKLNSDTYLTPIPVDDDLSSLSAILLDEIYYRYILDHSEIVEGIHIARKEALIVLKAKAYLDISERIKQGGREDNKHLKKHKNDVFKLTMLFTEEEVFELPESIESMLIDFLKMTKEDLPTEDVFKGMGMRGVTGIQALTVIQNIFKITDRDLS